MRYILLIITAVFSTQLLPQATVRCDTRIPTEWTRREVKNLADKFNDLLLFFLDMPPYKEMDPLGKRDAGEGFEDWYKANKVILKKNRVVYAIFTYMMNAKGYGPGDKSPTSLCISLEGALALYECISTTHSSDGKQLLELLKRDFGLDIEFFKAVYEAEATVQYGIHWLEKCPCPDRDGDGVCDKDDRCPAVPGPVSNQGCPSVVCPDRDGDGVCDKDDRCPAVPGPVSNQGCPLVVCPDRDGDGVCDKDDRCPDVKGFIEYQGCQPDTTIKTPAGDMRINSDRASMMIGGKFESASNAGTLLAKLMANGDFSTETFLMKQAPSIGYLSSKFQGSKRILLQIDLLDSLRHQLILFPEGKFWINTENGSFWKNANEAMDGFAQALSIVRDTFQLKDEGMMVLLQGMADAKPLERRKMPEGKIYRMPPYDPVEYICFEAGEHQFITKRLEIGDFYDNKKLSFLRAAFLFLQFTDQEALFRYKSKSQLQIVESVVTGSIDPEQRNATVFLAIDEDKLLEAANNIFHEPLRRRAIELQKGRLTRRP